MGRAKNTSVKEVHRFTVEDGTITTTHIHAVCYVKPVGPVGNRGVELRINNQYCGKDDLLQLAHELKYIAEVL